MVAYRLGLLFPLSRNKQLKTAKQTLQVCIVKSEVHPPVISLPKRSFMRIDLLQMSQGIGLNPK